LARLHSQLDEPTITPLRPRQVDNRPVDRISQIRQIDLAPVGHPAAAIRYLCTAAADDLVGKALALNDPDFRRRVGLV